MILVFSDVNNNCFNSGSCIIYNYCIIGDNYIVVFIFIVVNDIVVIVLFSL